MVLKFRMLRIASFKTWNVAPPNGLGSSWGDPDADGPGTQIVVESRSLKQ